MNDITIEISDRVGASPAPKTRDSAPGTTTGQAKGGRTGGGRQVLRRRWFLPLLRKRTRNAALALVLVGGGLIFPAWMVRSGIARNRNSTTSSGRH